MSNNYFKDKVAVITGASSGIGRELSMRLASRGACLVMAARNADKLEEARTACESSGGKAIGAPTDVAERSQCEALIQKAIAACGRIDILVNNAGISMWALFDEVTDLDIFETIMSVNYLGSVYCTYFALPYLKKTKGLIVGVSSLTGKNGVPTRSGYAASKHAMAGFFDTLRIELKSAGVGVTMIYPGFVATEVRQRAFGPDGKPLGGSPVQEGKIMTVGQCVDLILPAMEKRKREVVMTLKGKAGVLLKAIAPGLVDNIARKAIAKGR
ncbi:MAG: SDR family oxidoreductase [Spirochaetales bacterium]|nr:SDR family oxidoreductase [Spirochaetales bacterium]